MKKGIVNAFAFLMLVSCTSEPLDVLDPQSQGQGSPVHISFTIEEDIVTDTRAAIDSYYLTDADARIGIYALRQKLDPGTGEYRMWNNKEQKNDNTWMQSNMQANFINACYKPSVKVTDRHGTFYSYVADSENGTSEGRFPAGENTALLFYAYYPYRPNDQIEDAEGREILTAKSPKLLNVSAQEQIDYLYSGATIVYSNAVSAQIKLHHAMARIQIYVRTNPDRSHGGDKTFNRPKLAKVELFTNNIQEGSLDIETGNLKSANSGQNNVMWQSDTETLTTEFPDRPQADLLIFPKESGPTLDALCISIYKTAPESSRRDVIYATELTELWNESLSGYTVERGKVTKLYITY